MSKLLAALVATGGASVAVVGGSYLMNREGEKGDVSGESDPSSTPVTESISEDLSFTDLNGFKTNKGGDCAKYFYNGGNAVDLSSGGEEINSSNHKIDANYFSDGTDGKSCLVVNWERTDSSSGSSSQKWKGNFRWVWSFVKGNKGFIMFTTTKLTSSTDSSAKQLDLEGGIYFLKKDGGNWSLDKYKTLSNKNISKSNFTNAFPKVGESLTDLTNKEYWGFVTGDSDLDTVCKKSEESGCTQTSDQEKKFKGVWVWSTGTDNSGTLIKWCKDFENYFKSMYEEGEIPLKDNLSSLSGAWTNKHLSPLDN